MPELQTGSETLDARPVHRDYAVAMGVVWRAFWGSRALVWVAGLGALAVFGMASHSTVRLDPYGLTMPFDSDTANALLAPALRWDAAHYLEIATFGYHNPTEAAFFPLYPLLIASGGVGDGVLAFGIGISIGAALAGLLVLYRLIELDFGARVAAATILIVAWFPGSLAFSGVYTDSLFLLISVSSIWFARTGHWARAGLLGAFAAATRSGGIVLVVPLIALYLWGPRADREASAGPVGPLRVRYRPEPSAAWIALVPLGVLAYVAYLGITTGHPLEFISAQGEWHRIFAPLAGIPLALWKGIQGLAQFLPGVGPHSALSPGGRYPIYEGLRNVVLLGFLAMALWLLRESVRRLPFAYTGYAAAALALPLSVPATGEPLESLPRFMAVIFPLWIALAIWALERERARMRWVLCSFGVLLAASAGLFTTWVQSP